MERTIERMIAYVTTYGLQILAAIVIFIVGRWIAGAVTRFTEKTLTKRNADPAITGFIKNMVYFGLMTFVILAVLSRLGIQTTSFIAVLGAAGLAVGLALQGSLANFASGVLIIMFKPFTIGQFIIGGGVMGTVKEIGIFNTILSSPDNVKVIVPNAQLTSGSITNYSANETRRVDLEFGIAYGDDIKKAKDVFWEVLKADERILADPAPTVAVKELADSSVNFVVRPWIKSSEYWSVYFDLTENIKLALEKNGLTIPFPQRDLYIKENAPAEGSRAAELVGKK